MSPRQELPNEIYISRVYDAPVQKVWDAWVDPDKVAQWWGPRGFTITTHSKDVRTGGTWDYIMHGPDGTDYPNNTKYLEVERYSRMVYDHGAHGDQPPLFRVTVTFHEKDEKTAMDMTMTLPTAERASEIKKFIAQAGGDATWDRLAEFLSDDDIFVINRSFDIPINALFDMWTDPAQISQWLPPTGSTMEYLNADIKEGGSSFYCMTYSDDLSLYGKASYKEISKPYRLVYTQIFCDAEGNTSRHPLAPTWPETMLTTVTFTEENKNRTRITVTWSIQGEATREERTTFRDARIHMTQGWTGSFNKLECALV